MVFTGRELFNSSSLLEGTSMLENVTCGPRAYDTLPLPLWLKGMRRKECVFCVVVWEVHKIFYLET